MPALSWSSLLPSCVSTFAPNRRAEVNDASRALSVSNASGSPKHNRSGHLNWYLTASKDDWPTPQRPHLKVNAAVAALSRFPNRLAHRVDAPPYHVHKPRQSRRTNKFLVRRGGRRDFRPASPALPISCPNSFFFFLSLPSAPTSNTSKSTNRSPSSNCSKLPRLPCTHPQPSPHLVLSHVAVSY